MSYKTASTLDGGQPNTVATSAAEKIQEGRPPDWLSGVLGNFSGRHKQVKGSYSSGSRDLDKAGVIIK